MQFSAVESVLIFQSTLPVGGATEALARGGSRYEISIHAPRGGSDFALCRFHWAFWHFNPRSPWGERQPKTLERLLAGFISIHAPRGGSDTLWHGCFYSLPDFNPRSPWGERQQRCTNFEVHLWQRGRIFAFLREERRDSHQAAALRDRFFDGNLGANLPAFSVYYGFAVRESRCPPANSCSCSQNAPPSFRTGYPGSKTAASPFRHP